MSAVLLCFLLFLGCGLAIEKTFVLNAVGITSWTFTSGATGANPSLEAAVGDSLVFQVSSVPGHLFAIHDSEGTRVVTDPTTLTADGSLTLTVDAAMAGQTLTYICEFHSAMQGSIVVAGDDCTTPAENCTTPGDTCGTCDTCQTGYYKTEANICAECTSIANCTANNSTCTGLNTGQSCTQCLPNFFIDGTGCTICAACVAPEVPNVNCSGSTTSDTHTCTTGCALPKNCATGTCGGDCTTCRPGFYPANSGNSCLKCATIAHCAPLNITCTGANTGQSCSLCKIGYHKSEGGGCTACSKCDTGEYISTPCNRKGNQDTVCEACADCPSGLNVTVDCPGTKANDTRECSNTTTCPHPHCANCTSGGNSNGTSNGTSGGNCTNGNCTSECTQCEKGFYLSNGTCSRCLLANCLLAVCTGPNDTATNCSACKIGYYKHEGGCTKCDVCSNGTTLKKPCNGTASTDNKVCVDSNSTGCRPGYASLGDFCVPRLCLLFGCHFSALNITCNEVSPTQFQCICNPTAEPYNVTLPNHFPGCRGPHPSVAEILASITEEQVQAFLANAIPELESIILKRTGNNTLTLHIESSTDASELVDEFKQAISDLIGNGLEPSDIDVKVKPDTRKRVTYKSTVTATVNEVVSPAWRFDVLVALLVSVAFCVLAH